MTRRMRFKTWCKKDVDDERKINYKFTMKDEEEKVVEFTSEDEMPIWMIGRIREAWVRKIELINDEWYAEIYED